MKKKNIKSISGEALDAFWQVVVKHCPEARTGELSPWTTILLHNAAENAVEEWIDANVPAKHR